MQLELDSGQAPFAREQERFKMLRILNDERVKYSKGKKLDLEWLLNRIGSVSKPKEEEALEDDSLQAALTAQVQMNNYECKGTLGKGLACLKRSQNSSK